MIKTRKLIEELKQFYAHEKIVFLVLLILGIFLIFLVFTKTVISGLKLWILLGIAVVIFFLAVSFIIKEKDITR